MATVFEQVRRQVAIAGRVTDALTAAPLPGAVVTIIAAPGGAGGFIRPLPPAPVGPAADGLYYYLDLSDGAYTLEATLPGAATRYGKASVQVTVTRNPTGKIGLAAADLALPPTTVKGRVTGPGNAPLNLAQVRVRGSGERTFTDRQGDYILAGVEAGSRSIEISAQGFQTAVQTVQFGQPGALETLNVVLISQ